MQEPYSWKNRPVGFGSSAKLAYATETPMPNPHHGEEASLMRKGNW